MHGAPYLQVPLFGGDGLQGHALIEPDDLHFVQWYRWCLDNNGYARTRTKADGVLLMHRHLMGLKKGDGLEVDHVNGDGLDNRRSNLRVCTHAENVQNRSSAPGSTSRYRAVYWDRQKRKWRARVHTQGRYHHVGYFASEAEAGAAAEEYVLTHMTHAVPASRRVR